MLEIGGTLLLLGFDCIKACLKGSQFWLRGLRGHKKETEELNVYACAFEQDKQNPYLLTRSYGIKSFSLSNCLVRVAVV